MSGTPKNHQPDNSHLILPKLPKINFSCWNVEKKIRFRGTFSWKDYLLLLWRSLTLNLWHNQQEPLPRKLRPIFYSEISHTTWKMLSKPCFFIFPWTIFIRPRLKLVKELVGEKNHLNILWAWCNCEKRIRYLVEYFSNKIKEKWSRVNMQEPIKSVSFSRTVSRFAE